ncbi:MAG: hypothetical protein HYR85_03835 [Planctomycetes bacterium]|nr:hypothetical protein [Planctomycetota bacterium]MBI3848497.1 hypothetical protein [Planctomycetota bacterium]
MSIPQPHSFRWRLLVGMVKFAPALMFVGLAIAAIGVAGFIGAISWMNFGEWDRKANLLVADLGLLVCCFGGYGLLFRAVSRHLARLWMYPACDAGNDRDRVSCHRCGRASDSP